MDDKVALGSMQELYPYPMLIPEAMLQQAQFQVVLTLLRRRME